MYKRVPACILYHDLYKSCLYDNKKKGLSKKDIKEKCKKYLNLLQGNLCITEFMKDTEIPVSER